MHKESAESVQMFGGSTPWPNFECLLSFVFVQTSQKSFLRARMRVDINTDNIGRLSKKRSVNVFPESGAQARGRVAVQNNLTSFIFFDRAVEYHHTQNNFLRTKIVLAACLFRWKQYKQRSKQCQS